MKYKLNDEVRITKGWYTDQEGIVMEYSWLFGYMVHIRGIGCEYFRGWNLSHLTQ